MPSRTHQTTAGTGRIITRSGVILTPLHVPKPRSKTSPIEWVHSGDKSKPPFDWDATGLGHNAAFDDEMFRTRIPVLPLGANLEQPPLYFTEDGRGVSMEEALRWSSGAEQYVRRGVKWTNMVKDPRLARNFLLRIRWPGTERVWTYPVSPDGTYGSIAVGISKAYRYFLKCDAAKHKWEQNTQSLWDVAKFDISTLRLQALYWVGQTGPSEGWMNIYEADVHLVFKVELSDEPALFLSRQLGGI